MKTVHVVLLSGGIDSAVTLTQVLSHTQSDPVVAVNVRYPSKHNNLEAEAAHAVARYYDIKIFPLDLNWLFKNFVSSLLLSSSEPIPEGHYTAENMRSTVVPMRNVIFSTILAGVVMCQYPEHQIYLWMGMHAGDHAIYPDCRPETVTPLKEAVLQASDKRVTLITPFLSETKDEIVRLGWHRNVPFDLTRTCYTDNPVACGKCGSCNERLAAFAANHITDPLRYQQ